MEESEELGRAGGRGRTRQVQIRTSIQIQLILDELVHGRSVDALGRQPKLGDLLLGGVAAAVRIVVRGVVAVRVAPRPVVLVQRCNQLIRVHLQFPTAPSVSQLLSCPRY